MYIIKGRRYQEDPSEKLGGGSEGTIYPLPGNRLVCVKLFHEPDSSDPDSLDIARYRAEKIAAICSLRFNLPDQFIIPQTPALDGHGHIIGFVMRRLPMGFSKIMKLLESQFRTDHNLGLRKIIELHAYLFEDLPLVHSHRLSVGDVNLGCIMISPSLDRAWVDTDGWSYPGYPCLATTELFAHPDLYPNLNKSGKQFVPPQPHHDYFAFTVMFVLMALHGAHPFRLGTHPNVYSLQERTQQGITIFDPDVDYPKFLPRPEILSDDILHQVIQILKRKTKNSLDPGSLREFADALVECPSCGAQYHTSRTHCPSCQAKTVVDIRKLVELFIDDKFFQIPGVLLFAQVIDDILHMVCRVNDKVQIIAVDEYKNASVINTTIPTIHGARYRFFGSCLAVCPNPYAEVPVSIQLYKIEAGKLCQLRDVSTGVLENQSAVLDSSARFFYRTAGNSLLCGRLFGTNMLLEERAAQVHRSQSWFSVDRLSGADREAIFGYDRALRDWQWFVIHGDKDGNRFNYHKVDLPLLRSQEKLVDFAVYFNVDSVLLVRKTQCQGKEVARYSIIRLDGSIQDDALLESGDEGYDCWVHVSGKLYQKYSILHVTPDGVIKHSLPNNTYGILEDTRGVITADDRLFRFGKKVGVARSNTILTLGKK